MFKKITTKLVNTFKNRKSVVIGSMVAVGLLVGIGAPKLMAEFYPNRAIFDYNKPCNPSDADKGDRCGSLEGPVFNSFINTPSYGDERAFVDARRTDQTASGSFKNVLADVNQGSKEIVVRMYVHNNANKDTNANGLGVAKNTRVRVAVPTASSNSLRARGYISADNAKPQIISDTVDFTANSNFSVEYVKGSAVMFNATSPNGRALSDAIVTDQGALIGDTPNGNLPGCFEHEVVVQVKLKVKSPQLKTDKLVRMAGTKDWKESVNTKPGDKVEWLIETVNTGTTNNTHTTVRDQLPPHVTFVNGSMKWIDSNRPAGDVLPNQTALFTSGGVDFGTYGPGGGFYVMFATTVNAAKDIPECVTTIRNTAWAKSTESPERPDQATVIITKENCNPENPTPQFELVKDVRKKGDTNWQQDVTVEYGDTVQYRILVKNTGNTDLKNVLVKDNRPTGVDYINDTLKVNGQNSTGDLFGAGVTIPEIKKGATAEITFDAKVTTGQTDKCEVKKFRNIASAKPEGLQPKEDDANVNTKCNVKPAYECTSIDTIALGSNNYRFTVNTRTEGGARVNVYIYNFGDGGSEFTTDNNVVEHQYAKAGEYTITTRVLFTVGSEVKEARCATKVNIPVTPCPIPGKENLPKDSTDCKETSTPPVTEIPSTGAGSVVTGVAGSSLTAYGAYSLFLKRRALKNLK